jgi:hypothetical protein
MPVHRQVGGRHMLVVLGQVVGDREPPRLGADETGIG